LPTKKQDYKLKILFIVNTYGIEYDERILKEANTLKELGHDVHILALELANNSQIGITNQGIPYRTITLLSRRLLPRKRLLSVKGIEMYMRFLFQVKLPKYDIIWIHEHDVSGLIIIFRIYQLLGSKVKLVWDQHELWPIKRLEMRLYNWLISKSNAIITANEDRAEIMNKIIPSLKTPNKLFIIHNYLDKSIISENIGLNKNFEEWLDGSKYVLFQGGAFKHRKIFECIEAVYNIGNIKLLIMGPCDSETLNIINNRWPDYKNWLFITDWISPSDFLSFMDAAFVSLIFYENIDINHWLCEPNRLYYAILRGIPVICGPNPPMRRLIEKYKIGEVVASNGENSSEIEKALQTVLSNELYYRTNCTHCRNEFVWQKQKGIVKHIIDNL